MPAYYCTLTTVGASKLAQAATQGPRLAISHVAIGDGNPLEVEPSEETVLVSERYRCPVNEVYSPLEDQSVVIIEAAIPTDVGGWDVNEVGLFDSAGDLIAIANYPRTYKPKITEGIGRVLLVRVMLDVGNAEHVILQIDPAMVMATQQFVTLAVQALADDAADTYLVKAQNLADVPDKVAARFSLEILSAVESDERYLNKSENLADVPDKAAARDNLEVYSVDQVNQRTRDSTTEIKGVNRHATSAETIAGLIDDASVTPEGLKARDSARRYETTPTPFVNGGSISAAHGLGAAPAKFWLILICTADNNGFFVGERIDVSYNQSWNNDYQTRGTTIAANATTVRADLGPFLVRGLATSGASWDVQIGVEL